MKMKRFKKGAASFYVVAFSTLILLIIVASFTALVVAQITRSSNADLAQSAYDSALAGVEDAKLAFYSYRNCLNKGAVAKAPEEGEEIDCPQIIYMMENSGEDDCDVVARILGRTDEGTGVMVEESSGNNMQQAYTCVKVRTKMKSYNASLSADEQMRVIRPRFDGVSANDIKSIRLSWGMSGQNTKFSDFNPVFPSVLNFAGILNPPVLSVAILQAGAEFDLSSFDKVVNSGDTYKTNRGMVFLVPRDAANSQENDNYIVAPSNTISASNWVKSNDRTYVNKPFAVDCNLSSENYLCVATLELPDTVEGGRSDENFAVIVTTPYGKSTDFKLEFCTSVAECDSSTVEIGGETNSSVTLKGMLGVDSTGRANDLYRRVETVLVEKDDSLLSIMGPLELFGDENATGGGSDDGSDSALKKNLSVTCEWNLPRDDTLLSSNGCL